MKNNDTNGISYYLRTAFDYEMRNYIELRIAQLKSETDSTQEQLSELANLVLVKEYFENRMNQLRA